jgi:hypothetical protein
VAVSFRRNGDATFSITIPIIERQLLEQLVPQMRELIQQHDPLTWRLFPNPYPDHEKAADEYSDLIGNDLSDKHVAALDTVEATLDAKRLDEDQMVAWMHALNHLRLVIGTRLKVREESELDEYEDDTERSLFSTYSYLGWMLEQIVYALSGE